jgi:hypothetical protein
MKTRQQHSPITLMPSMHPVHFKSLQSTCIRVNKLREHFLLAFSIAFLRRNLIFNLVYYLVDSCPPCWLFLGISSIYDVIVGISLICISQGHSENFVRQSRILRPVLVKLTICELK